MNTEFEKELEHLSYEGIEYPLPEGLKQIITKAHNQHLRTVLEGLHGNMVSGSSQSEGDGWVLPEGAILAEIAKLKEKK